MRSGRAAILSALLLLALAREAGANPIISDFYGGAADGQLFLATVLFSLLVEYVAVRLLLRRQVGLARLLAAFAVANAISFPLTLFFGFFLFWLAEGIPLLLEPGLYRWVLRSRPAGLFKKLAIANLVGFAFGLLMYHVLGPWLRAVLPSWP